MAVEIKDKMEIQLHIVALNQMTILNWCINGLIIH